ncbi:hypothetical protein V6N11_055916 [Hibiscus sabdariffa]|uniref:Uncharacterized protein n=1 Tax=Hibiscus sabdariffa TaxID=183260 RepID=A0ABR2T2A6_9ROSI
MMGLSASAFAWGVKDRLCELGNCPQTVGCGVLRGSARPTTAANVNLGSFYLVGMPLALGLGFYKRVGFSGLWLGLLSAQVCCAGLMLLSDDDYDNKVEEERHLICITVT